MKTAERILVGYTCSATSGPVLTSSPLPQDNFLIFFLPLGNIDTLFAIEIQFLNAPPTVFLQKESLFFWKKKQNKTPLTEPRALREGFNYYINCNHQDKLGPSRSKLLGRFLGCFQENGKTFLDRRGQKREGGWQGKGTAFFQAVNFASLKKPFPL